MRLSLDVGESAVQRAPYRTVVVGDFAAGQSASRTWIDASDFADVLARIVGEVVFGVPNHLAERPTELVVRFAPQSLADLTPAGLADAIPELGRAVEFRDQLLAVRDRRISRAEFDRGLDRFSELTALSAPLAVLRGGDAPATPLAGGGASTDDDGDDALARIFEMVDTETRPEPEAHVAGGVAGAIDATEALLSRQLDAVLHAPVFQDLEATWRGLKMLVDHTDFREGMQIDLVSAPRDGLADAVRDQVVEPEERGAVTAPLSLIVVDVALDHSSRDLDLLQHLGEQAERLQVPLLCSASPRFFGLSTGAELGASGYVGTTLDQPQYDQWRALRDKEVARWLAVCCNGVLLRSAHTADRRRSLGLDESTRRHGDNLWGRPAWVLASTIAASFARTGWPTECSGPDGGAVAGLDVRSIDPAAGDSDQIPLESTLSDQVGIDLAEAGFVPLQCRINRDVAYVLRAPTVRRPETFAGGEATAASRAMTRLPYQLLVARIADAVARHKTALAARSGDLSAELEKFLRGLVADSGSGAAVEVNTGVDPDSGREVVEVRVRTGAVVLGGAEVHLAF